MQIPHDQLEQATLRAVIQEFVTRDGTDDSPVDERIHAVVRQLETGRAELHWDEETRSCNILPAGHPG